MKQAWAWEKKIKKAGPACLLDFNYEELAQRFADWQLHASAVNKVFQAIHRKGLVDYANLRPFNLPQNLWQKIEAGKVPPISSLVKVETFPSADGSVKYLFQLNSGEKVEGVFMPAENRVTLCISSQVGCAMGCTFCATGAMGFKRHLSTGEILAQIYRMMQDVPQPKGQTTRVNVVFMGMGEPLHNLDNLMEAVRALKHPHGRVMSWRDISVSTSGLVPKIQEMAELEERPLLMVSIAATTDEARARIMPVNRAYPLEELLGCLETYPLRPRERIMLSYVVIAGMNDTEADQDRLVAMCRRFPCMLNLIPMNAHAESPGFNEPEEEHLQWFYRGLVERGVFATVRRSKGRDVAGACGQLANNPRPMMQPQPDLIA